MAFSILISHVLASGPKILKHLIVAYFIYFKETWPDNITNDNGDNDSYFCIRSRKHSV